MADAKISALPASTTPLAGTEVLPIVQSGVTKQVSVANLTAGRDTTIANLVAYNPGYGYFAIRNSALVADFPNNALAQSADALNTIVNAKAGGTVKLRINDTSVVEVATNTTLVSGNLVIGTSGNGIDFSATSGTGTSELLSDYEEGTWTPVDSSGAGLTLTISAARYTKIGRTVFVQARITYPSTASTATVLIGGLPFTSSADSRTGLSLGYNNFVANYLPFISASSGLVELFTVAGSGAQPTNVNLSTRAFAFSGFYTV